MVAVYPVPSIEDDYVRAGSPLKERWTFDGWELTYGNGIRDWESYDGTDGIAPFVGDNATTANRSAELWRPKTIGPGKFTIALWVAGDNRLEAMANWNNIVRAFVRPFRQVRVVRWLPDGNSIFCDAEVSGGIEPTHIGQQGYRASVTFTVPSGVWLSSTSYTHSSTTGSTLPKTVTLDDLTTSTAPLELLKYRIKGPITNPKLSDGTPGGYGDTLTYMGTVASGQELVINASNWTTTGSTFAVNNGLLVPTGRRLMAIATAQPGDTPTVTLSGTGGGTLTQLIVEGRANYLA